MLSLAVVGVVVGGIVMIAYSLSNAYLPFGLSWAGATWSKGSADAEVPGKLRWGLRWQRCYVTVELSEEFKQKVISMAEVDQDVQNLLNSGYNITSIRPVIKITIEGDGNVVAKARGAIVTLVKGATSRATVAVDLENAKVTKVTVLTRTVIEKP